MKAHTQRGDTVIETFVFHKSKKWGKIQLNILAHDENHKDAIGARMRTQIFGCPSLDRSIMGVTTGLQGSDNAFCGFGLNNFNGPEDISIEIFWEGENQEAVIIGALEKALKELKNKT